MQVLLDLYGPVGLFKGLGWRIALISTTFFLVNNFKDVSVQWPGNRAHNTSFSVGLCACVDVCSV